MGAARDSYETALRLHPGAARSSTSRSPATSSPSSKLVDMVLEIQKGILRRAADRAG